MAASPALPALPSNWSIKFTSTTYGACTQYVARLTRDGVEECRISVMGTPEDADTAKLSAAVKAWAWVEAFEHRTSGFLPRGAATG